MKCLQVNNEAQRASRILHFNPELCVLSYIGKMVMKIELLLYLDIPILVPYLDFLTILLCHFTSESMLVHSFYSKLNYKPIKSE